jgi:hypothetical protein
MMQYLRRLLLVAYFDRQDASVLSSPVHRNAKTIERYQHDVSKNLRDTSEKGAEQHVRAQRRNTATLVLRYFAYKNNTVSCHLAKTTQNTSTATTDLEGKSRL